MGIKNKTPEERYTLDIQFLEQVRKKGLPSEEFARDIKKKTELLIFYCYDYLQGKGSKNFLKPSEASPARINNAFWNTYNDARAQVEKMEKKDKGHNYKQIERSLFKENYAVDSELEFLSEKIAILMDSSNSLTLNLLSRIHGPKQMGDYFVPKQ